MFLRAFFPHKFPLFFSFHALCTRLKNHLFNVFILHVEGKASSLLHTNRARLVVNCFSYHIELHEATSTEKGILFLKIYIPERDQRGKWNTRVIFFFFDCYFFGAFKLKCVLCLHEYITNWNWSLKFKGLKDLTKIRHSN